jgi:hypothetical protein
MFRADFSRNHRHGFRPSGRGKPRLSGGCSLADLAGKNVFPRHLHEAADRLEVTLSEETKLLNC